MGAMTLKISARKAHREQNLVQKEERNSKGQVRQWQEDTGTHREKMETRFQGACPEF